MTFRSLMRWWLPPLLLSLFILAAAGDSLSGEETVDWIRIAVETLGGSISDSALYGVNLAIRKTGHVATYALLAALYFRAVRAGRSGWRSSWAAAALVLALAVACGDEAKQSLTATRTGSPFDVVIDAAGATGALAILRRSAIRKRSV